MTKVLTKLGRQKWMKSVIKMKILHIFPTLNMCVF